jgi:hypothetical protein
MIAWPLLQPVANQCCLVSAVVIQHQMDVEVSRDSSVYLPQEVKKLYRTVSSIALAEYTASGYIESRKQAGDAVSFVIVGAVLLTRGWLPERVYVPLSPFY